MTLFKCLALQTRRIAVAAVNRQLYVAEQMAKRQPLVENDTSPLLEALMHRRAPRCPKSASERAATTYLTNWTVETRSLPLRPPRHRHPCRPLLRRVHHYFRRQRSVCERGKQLSLNRYSKRSTALAHVAEVRARGILVATVDSPTMRNRRPTEDCPRRRTLWLRVLKSY